MLNSNFSAEGWIVLSDDEEIGFATLDSALAYAKGRAHGKDLIIERSEERKVICLVDQTELLAA